MKIEWVNALYAHNVIIYIIFTNNRSGTKMNAEQTYVTLAAIQGELQSTSSELFSMFCIEHKDNGGNKNARRAFANILKKSNQGWSTSNKVFYLIFIPFSYVLIERTILADQYCAQRGFF